MQRHDVASTLRRRCINVMCLLGWNVVYSSDASSDLLQFNIIIFHLCFSLRLNILATFLSLFSCTVAWRFDWQPNIIDSTKELFTVCRIWPKYWWITPDHTSRKFWTNPFLLPVDVSENCWTTCKQFRPRSDAAFCGVWSGSTLFALIFTVYTVNSHTVEILSIF